MKAVNCKTVRRELDDVMPHDNFSVAAKEHLKGCSGCLDIYQKQVRLQQIIGELQPIEAPEDFSFRLRSRLAQAHEPGRSWILSTQGLSWATAMVLAVSAILGYQFIKGGKTPVLTEVRQQNNPASDTKPIETAETAVASKAADHETSEVTPNPLVTKQPRTSHLFVSQKNQSRVQASVDFSSEGATRIRQVPTVAFDEGPAFPIYAPLQGVRLSIDDGRGNARTISLPGVSFGSQRVLASASQGAPKGVW